MPARYFDAMPLYQDEQKSVALIELNGVNDVVKNLGSTTTYEVIAGHGQFAVRHNDSQPRHIIQVCAGSVLRISPGTEYQDRGDLTMIATSEPPFDQSKTKIIQESETLSPLFSAIL